MEKIEGEKCQDCGVGKIIKNPKTGKLFCDQKCWLKNQPHQEQPAIVEGEDAKWERIGQAKMRTKLAEAMIRAGMTPDQGHVVMKDWVEIVMNIYDPNAAQKADLDEVEKSIPF